MAGQGQTGGGCDVVPQGRRHVPARHSVSHGHYTRRRCHNQPQRSSRLWCQPPATLRYWRVCTASPREPTHRPPSASSMRLQTRRHVESRCTKSRFPFQIPQGSTNIRRRSFTLVRLASATFLWPRKVGGLWVCLTTDKSRHQRRVNSRPQMMMAASCGGKHCHGVSRVPRRATWVGGWPTDGALLVRTRQPSAVLTATACVVILKLPSRNSTRSLWRHSPSPAAQT